jgi:hypothetical protein
MSESANLRIIACLLLLPILCVSCAIPERPSFQLHILATSWDELELGYEREQAWNILKKADIKDSVVVITENDVEQYNWSKQSIMLTPAASDKLKGLYGVEYPFINLSNQGFVVTLQGDWLYGGVFLEFGSPMPIRYPVIYVESSGNSTIFHLCPSHPMPALYADLDSSYKSIIEIQKVHALFSEQGKLVE